MDQQNSCSVGQLTQTPCHKTVFISQQGLKNVEELSETDKEILFLRAEIMGESIVTLCLHHEYYYMTKFEEQQKSCCNPFQTHKKKVKASLRMINMSLAKELKHNYINVKPGQKICINCQKKAMKIEVGNSEPDPNNRTPQYECESSSDDESQLQESISKNEAISVINAGISNIGCSPLKLHSIPQHSRFSYGKRKMKQIKSNIKKKVSQVLEQEFSSSESENIQHCETQQKAKDLEKLVSLMKEKLPTLNRQRKIQMLTMAPPSWSRKLVSERFNVTDYLVRQSKTLVLEEGIMSLPEPRKGKKLSNETLESVQKFYEDDTSSRQMPGRKDFVSIKRNQHVQKRLILLNLKELYSLYKEKHQYMKVGFSKFCSLRPKWCVLVGAAGTHSVCICTIHQNVILLLSAAHLKESYKALMNYMVCDLNNRKCVLRHCVDCPSTDNLVMFLKSKFTEYDEDDTIEIRQWVSTGRTELTKQTVSMEEFIQMLVLKMEKLIPHSYIAKKQSKFLKDLKETLMADTAIIIMDFSENYSFVIQDEAQGYHWTSEACTVHPVIVHVKDNDTKLIKISSHCFLSDDLDHDVSMVYRIQQATIDYIKNKHPEVIKVHYFTDGCAAQYKNRKSFLNLCQHKNDFGISASWSFFATSHGKSSCDGVGGTVKRIVSKASLQRPITDQITKPIDVFNFCTQNIKNIQFYFIKKNEIEIIRNNLHQRFSKIKVIPGTRSFHYFCPVSSNSIGMKRVSSDDKYNLIYRLKSITETINWSHLYTQCYIACTYDDNWFFGVVTAMEEEEGDVRVKFMHPHGPATSFYWPNHDDICYVPLQHILCIVQPPMSTSTGRTYYFSKEDIKAVDIKWSLAQESLP